MSDSESDSEEIHFVGWREKLEPTPILEKTSQFITNQWSRHWLQFVKNNPESWNKRYLSRDQYASLELIEEFMEEPFFGEEISPDGNCFWDWDWLSRNPNITSDFIEKHLEKPWNWNLLSFHPSLTFEILQKKLSFEREKDPESARWIWRHFIQNSPNVSDDLIRAHPQLKWTWRYLSLNSKISWDFIQAHSDKPWDWWRLSSRPDLTWEIVQNNFDKEWCWYHLTEHPNIPLEIILGNMDNPWDYEWSFKALSKRIDWNQDLPNKWQIIENHPGDWDWEWISEKISQNPDLTLKFVQDNPNIRWNYQILLIDRISQFRQEFIDERLEKYNLIVHSICQRFEVPIDLEKEILKFL